MSPEVRPGGGVSSGLLGGELNVFVIDGRSDEPIEGASVWVRGGVASTTSEGLAIFDDSALDSPQTVTAVADGYAAATWIGVDGAVVTIPLALAGELDALPTATASGSIAGWAELPAPVAGHQLAAGLLYSFNPGGPGLPADNLALQCPSSAPAVDPCEWSLVTRTGRLAILAVLVDIDTHGTADDSDDDVRVLGYALKTELDLLEGDSVEGVVLERIDEADLVEASVSYGPLPPPFEAAEWSPLLDLGEQGWLPLFVLPGKQPVDVPSLTGDLSSASYVALAMAVGPDQPPVVASLLTKTGLDFQEEVDLGSWLDVPGALDSRGRTFSFSPVADTVMHRVFLWGRFLHISWDVLILDGARSFSLPDFSPDPLAQGVRFASVAANDIPDFDPTDFALEELIHGDTRQSLITDSVLDP